MRFLRELAQLSMAPNPGSARAALPARFASGHAALVASEPLQSSEALALEVELPAAPAVMNQHISPAGNQVAPAPHSRVRGERDADPSEAPRPAFEPRVDNSAPKPYAARLAATQLGAAQRFAPDLGAVNSSSPAAGVAGAPLAAVPPIAHSRARPAAWSPPHPSIAISRAQIDAHTPVGDEPLAPGAQENIAQRGLGAPLSHEAVVSRIPSAAAQQPIIHVSIDRIDVRAPGAPTRSARSRPTPTPSISLSDYLRRGKRAGGTS